MNLSESPIQELKDLLKEVPRKILRREKSKKQSICKESEALAAKAGGMLVDLLREAAKRSKRLGMLRRNIAIALWRAKRRGKPSHQLTCLSNARL